MKENFQLNICFERSSNPPISEPSVHHQPRGDFQFSMWLRNPLTSYKLYCLTPFFRMWSTLPISFSLFWSLLRVESSSTRYNNAWNNVSIWTKILKSRPVSDHWEDEIEWERSKASFFPGFQQFVNLYPNNLRLMVQSCQFTDCLGHILPPLKEDLPSRPEAWKRLALFLRRDPAYCELKTKSWLDRSSNIVWHGILLGEDNRYGSEQVGSPWNEAQVGGGCLWY